MEIIISSVLIAIVMFLILLPSMKTEIQRNKQVKLKEPKHAEFKIQRKDKIDIKTIDNDKKDE